MAKSIKEMTDAELIQIIHARDYVVGDQPIRNEARTELHSRQKKIDSSINRRTLWILIFTIIGVILALVLLLFEYIIPIPKSHKSTLTTPYSKRKDYNNERQNKVIQCKIKII